MLAQTHTGAREETDYHDRRRGHYFFRHHTSTRVRLPLSFHYCQEQIDAFFGRTGCRLRNAEITRLHEA